MIYSGKQIRIEFLDGDQEVYRGSAWSCIIHDTSVTIYQNNVRYADFPTTIIKKITDSQFLSEDIK